MKEIYVALFGITGLLVTILISWIVGRWIAKEDQKTREEKERESKVGIIN